MYSEGFRIAALRLYDSLKNMKKVSKLLKIGVGTIWRWVNQGIQFHPRATTPMYKCVDELVIFIKSKLQACPYLSQIQLKALVFETFGVNISRQSISCALKRIGFSRKRLRRRGFVKKAELYDKYKTFNDLYSSKIYNNIIAVDEIGFDFRTQPLYGYSKKGTKAITHWKSSNRTRTSMIMAIDRKGRYFCQLLHGTTNAERFSKFINKLPWPKGSVVMMDNASFHKGQVVNDALNERAYSSIFTPPYSPDCNPIENVFSVIKGSFRKQSVDDDVNIDMVIEQVTKSIDTTMFAKCFTRSEKHVQSELQKNELGIKEKN
jgi:transposase